VTLQRVEHDDPALHREAHHRPRRQKTAHVRAVEDRLAPAVLVEDVDADPAEPDGEDEYQRDVVDGGEERQIETGALAVQSRRADVHQERDGVADDSDEDDDRQNVDVQDRNDAVEFGVGFVHRQAGQLLKSTGQVVSAGVEADPEVLQQQRHSFVQQK